jgi:hypothetical protein
MSKQNRLARFGTVLRRDSMSRRRVAGVLAAAAAAVIAGVLTVSWRRSRTLVGVHINR